MGSENPYEAPQTPSERRARWPSVPEPFNSLASVLIVLVIVAIVVALLLPVNVVDSWVHP
jgi:hypothetical protein